MRDAAWVAMAAGIWLATAGVAESAAQDSATPPTAQEATAASPSAAESTDATPSAESAESAGGPAVAGKAGPGGGLTFSSPDGRFTMKLGGRLQTLYQLDAPDSGVYRSLYGSDGAAHPTSETTSLFRFRRGRLAFSGHVYDAAWQYKVQFELAGSSLSLKDAYVNWRAADDAVQVRMGQFKVPFGRQELTSIFKQGVIDRSLASQQFADGWDGGLMLWGEPFGGRVEYYVGVFNGEGANRKSQQDATNEWAGRLVWAPLGPVAYDATARSARDAGLAVAVNARRNGGWLYEVDGDPALSGPTERCTVDGCLVDEGDDATLLTLGADATFRWSGLTLTAEAFSRRIDPRASTLASLESTGWYAEGGHTVGERAEAGLRYGRVDPNRDQAGDRRSEVTPYAVVYLVGNDLKLQTDYTWTRSEHAGDARTLTADDQRFRLQFLLSF